MAQDLERVARRWTALGAADPLWAALTDRRRGSWTRGDFLASGRSEIDRLLALLDRRGLGPGPGTALDFGCGPGRLTAALAASGRFADVVGVDVSPSMIEAAGRNVDVPRCSFVLNRATDLAVVPSASVDLVYSGRVLQHMPPALSTAYLREFVRIAAPGGVVAFQLPSAPAGIAGTLLRLVPVRLLDRLRDGMQMHGVPTGGVLRLVAEEGAAVVAVEPDDSAGPRWRSHLYLVRKGGANTSGAAGSAPGAPARHNRGSTRPLTERSEP